MRTFRCSSLPRLAACAAAGEPPETWVEPLSDGSAELGSAFHEAMATKIRGGEPDLSQIAARWDVDVDDLTPMALWGFGQWNSLLVPMFPNPLIEEPLSLVDDEAGITLTGSGDVLALVDGEVRGLDYKCLALDQNVQMASGTSCPAGELVTGDIVLAWDGQGLRPARAVIADNGIQPVFTVRTRCGRIVKCTAEHPFLTRRGWVIAAELNKGDFARVAMGWTTERNDCSPETARFVGLMIADGNFSTGHCRWTKHDPALVSWVKEYLTARGADLTSGRSKPGEWNVSYARKLKELQPLFGYKAAEKTVPDFVLKGGKEAWRAFLSGYFDGDGHHRDTTKGPYDIIGWDSISRKLLEQCQQMLSYLNMRSTLNTLHGKFNNKPYISYRLVVRDRESLSLLGNQLQPMSWKGRNIKSLAGLLPGKALREWDQVISVEQGSQARTVAITVDDFHTVVAGGLVTHNSGYLKTDATDQLRGYGLLGLVRWPEATKIRMTTMRVRHRYLDTFIATRDEIMAWWEKLAKHLARTDEFHTGAHCGFCPRALECPAHRQALQSTATMLDTVQTGELQPEQLAGAVLQAKVLERRIKQFLDAAKAEVVARGGEWGQLRVVSTDKRTIDFPRCHELLVDTLGRDTLLPLLKVGKGDVEKAVRAKAAPRMGSKNVRFLFEQIEGLNAFKVSTSHTLEVTSDGSAIESGTGDDVAAVQ
jgi:LAGLIDADG-like domain/Protein of unknown function (DUF2800)